MKEKHILSIQAVLFVVFGYLAIAFAVFQWRNPLANKMSFYRDFGSVMRFEKVPGYQMPQ